MTFETSPTRRGSDDLVVYRDTRRRLTVIVSEEQYRWLCEIEQALGCRTWGELRAMAPADVYLEILDFAGFGDLADRLNDALCDRGQARWPHIIAQWQACSGRRLPPDHAAFSADRLDPVLGGAYPPDPWILMADAVPRRLLHFYEREWSQTSELGIDDRDVVAELLTELSRAGAVMRNALDPHERFRVLRAAG